MEFVLLLFVLGATAVGIAYALPDNVWDAIAERIRNPRPDRLAEQLRAIPQSQRDDDVDSGGGPHGS